jgi:hypothetical protein
MGPVGTMQVNGKQIPWAAAGTLLIGAGVLLATASLRGAECDEGYTLLLAAGTPRPAWPAGVFMAAEARAAFAGHASLAEVARELRTTDVHPRCISGRWRHGAGWPASACLACVCYRYCAVSWRWCWSAQSRSSPASRRRVRSC